MTKQTKRNTAIIAGVIASVALGASAQAQSSDSLLDKLVDKGILTVKEANELRQQSDKDSPAANKAKTSMPAWVDSWKIGGDFRGRFEQHHTDNTLNNDRNRYRYRLRLGATATILSDFDIGVRLASGNPTGAFGGNPVSANTDLSDGASRKFLWVDAAYAKWTPIHSGDWTLSGTFGKMDSPFTLSNMIFDGDYQPEGGALQASYKFNEDHNLKLNGGVFVLDEFNQGAGASHDPFVMGAQLLLESRWTPKIETALGISAFSIAGTSNLLNASAPNINAGNTRLVSTAPAFDFNPIIGNASVTYKLDSFPLYPGAFPIKLGGEFMRNPAAPANNEGWWLGATFGKAGHKGQWEIAYKYQRLGADAWYEEFPDDDNGGVYAGGLANSGFGAASFAGGTNVKGHVLKGSYSFNDSLTMSVTAYVTDLINPTANAVDGRSAATHLMVDLMWKF